MFSLRRGGARSAAPPPSLSLCDTFARSSIGIPVDHAAGTCVVDLEKANLDRSGRPRGIDAAISRKTRNITRFSVLSLYFDGRWTRGVERRLAERPNTDHTDSDGFNRLREPGHVSGFDLPSIATIRTLPE